MEEHLEGSFFTLSGLQASHPSHSHPLLRHSQRRVSLYLPISTSINLHLPYFSPQDPPLPLSTAASLLLVLPDLLGVTSSEQRGKGTAFKERRGRREQQGEINSGIFGGTCFSLINFSYVVTISCYFHGYLSVSIITCQWLTLQFQFKEVVQR